MAESETTRNQQTFVRLATTAAVASLFAYSCVLLGTYAVLNEIGKHFHVSYGRLGYVQMCMMIGFFCSVFAAGRLSDRYGRLPVILGGCVFMGAGAAVAACVREYALVVVGAAVMGVGGGMTEAIGMALVGDLHSGPHRTSMMNLSQSVFGLGAILAPMAAGQIIGAHLSWRLVFWGVAVLCAAAAVPTVIAAGMRYETVRRHTDDPARWTNLLWNRLVLMLALGLALYVGAELGQSSWMSVYFDKNLGSSVRLAAQSLTYMWLGILLGRLAAAWLARHIGDHAMIVGCLGFAAVSEAGLLLAPTPYVALVPAFSLGFFLGPIWPTIVSQAGLACPEQAGTATAIVVAAGSLGAVVFPPAVGWVADAFDLRAALWLCVVVLCANLALFTAIARRNKTKGGSLDG